MYFCETNSPDYGLGVKPKVPLYKRPVCKATVQIKTTAGGRGLEQISICRRLSQNHRLRPVSRSLSTPGKSCCCTVTRPGFGLSSAFYVLETFALFDY